MLFRYPGSKNKLTKPIGEWFANLYGPGKPNPEYREPFFGGGSVGLSLLDRFNAKGRVIPSYWFNDRDTALCCLWQSVHNDLEAVQERLEDFQVHLDGFQIPRVSGGEPTIQAIHLDSGGDLSPNALSRYLAPFYQKQVALRDLVTMPPVAERAGVAGDKIIVHQTSFSGLGTAAGVGPIGGKTQRSRWIMGCRFNPVTTMRKAAKVRSLLRSSRPHPDICTCLDFEEVLGASGDCCFYLDPPYFSEGPKLYANSFGLEDHRRLAMSLTAEARPWLLSYDACPEVRKLYDGFPGIELLEFPLRYTVVRPKGINEITNRRSETTGAELLVSNRSLESFSTLLR